jgi:hypothetical protein
MRPARWEQGLATTALRGVIASPDAVVLVAEGGKGSRAIGRFRAARPPTRLPGKEQE